MCLNNVLITPHNLAGWGDQAYVTTTTTTTQSPQYLDHRQPQGNPPVGQVDYIRPTFQNPLIAIYSESTSTSSTHPTSRACSAPTRACFRRSTKGAQICGPSIWHIIGASLRCLFISMY
jgi:hypothetical protein